MDGDNDWDSCNFCDIHNVIDNSDNDATDWKSKMVTVMTIEITVITEQQY